MRLVCDNELDSITDSMNMNLSKLQEIVEDRGAWRAVVHEIAKSRTWLSDWTPTMGHSPRVDRNSAAGQTTQAAVGPLALEVWTVATLGTGGAVTASGCWRYPTAWFTWVPLSIPGAKMVQENQEQQKAERTRGTRKESNGKHSRTGSRGDRPLSLVAPTRP